MAIWHCNPFELKQNTSQFPRLEYDGFFARATDGEAIAIGLTPCSSPLKWHVLNASQVSKDEFNRRLAIHLIRRRPLSAAEKSVMKSRLGKSLSLARGVNKYGILRHTLHFAIDDPQFVALHSTSRRPLWLEFGVYTGTSANVTSRYAEVLAGKLSPSRKSTDLQPVVVGFDTFEGLPEAWDLSGATYAKGAFSVDGKIPPVRSGIRLIKGLFNDTLPPFLASQSPETAFPLAWVNVDCDLLAGARQVLSMLRSRLLPGSRLHFHELMTSADWRWYAQRPLGHPLPTSPLSHEAVALHEWLRRHPKMVLKLLEVKSYQNTEAAAFVVVSPGFDRFRRSRL